MVRTITVSNDKKIAVPCQGRWDGDKAGTAALGCPAGRRSWSGSGPCDDSTDDQAGGTGASCACVDSRGRLSLRGLEREIQSVDPRSALRHRESGDLPSENRARIERRRSPSLCPVVLSAVMICGAHVSKFLSVRVRTRVCSGRAALGWTAEGGYPHATGCPPRHACNFLEPWRAARS
jgi:hypothetical protein